MAGLLLLLSCCSSVVYVESANQNSRIDYIVIHATSENFAESLRLLTVRNPNPVSAHYLIPAADDPSYPRRSLRIHSLVPEHRRAWHAGISYWEGEESLNDRSIGIELVNEFECVGTDVPVEDIILEHVSCEFPPYGEEQITLLIDLLKDIQRGNPGIDPIDIVGHSDIAIMRRSDPGPLFPWRRLYQEGIGAWPDAHVADSYQYQFYNAMPSASRLQTALNTLGYQLDVTGAWDAQTQFALRAFQLHFRPYDYSGEPDVETVALLWALLEKYRPEELAGLQSMEFPSAGTSSP